MRLRKALIAAILLGSAACSDAQYTLSIHAKQVQLKVGEPIPLAVTLKNSSGSLLWVLESHTNSGLVSIGLRVIVVDENGTTPAQTKYYRHLKGEFTLDEMVKDPNDRGGRINPLPLQPGETLERELDLKRLYNIDRPGKYVIWVERIDEDSRLRIQSNEITVEITGPPAHGSVTIPGHDEGSGSNGIESRLRPVPPATCATHSGSADVKLFLVFPLDAEREL